ncbi:MAG: hypothetical protein Q9219_000460 [cf. Caloplaca sp. 3 TL-2023]
MPIWGYDMDDQVPSTSLNAFIESRIGLDCINRGTVVQIQVPIPGAFSRASRPQRRVVSSTAACQNEESFNSSCLASASSIFFGKSRRYPRSFLWRVLENDKVLDIRVVDLSKNDRESKEATVILQLGFSSAVRKGCVALQDDGENSLSVFVLTKSNELFTFTIPTNFFCDVPASEKNLESWCNVFSHATISLCNPQRLVAANPQQLVITSDDGGILRLNRKSSQSDVAWEALACNQGKWSSSLRGLIRWQGSNSVRYNGMVLDPNTAIAAEFSPSRTHLLTVCVNHTLKIWNLEKGIIVFSMDLLGKEREPQHVARVLLDAGNPELLRIVEADGAIEGDKYYAVTYSPHEGGQFKIWAIRDADQGSLGIRFLHPDDILRPPDPEPGLERKAVWKLAGFEISQGTWGTAMEFWVLMKSNKRYKMNSLKFDLIDLPTAWSSDWTSVQQGILDQEPLPQLSLTNIQDITELWLEYLLHPRRYSRTALETALSAYCSARQNREGIEIRTSLEDRLCSAILTRTNALQAKDTKDHGTESAQYREALQREWMLFHQEAQDLEKSSWQALTLAFDIHSDMPWLVFNGGVAAIRECSQLESTAQNSPDVLRTCEGILEAPSIEDGHQQISKMPHELAALIQAAASFTDSFSSSFRKNCSAWLSGELWQDPLFSVPRRIETFYERCGIAWEVTETAIATLRAKLRSLGDFDSLTTHHFFSVIEAMLRLMTVERSDQIFTKFGLRVLVRGTQDMIDVYSKILSDLLVLVVFVEIEGDREITPKWKLKTSTVFMALLDQLRRYEMMKWLANSEWTVTEEGPKRPNSGIPNDPGLTVLETLFAGDVRPQLLKRQSEAATLSDTILDLLMWITGGNDPSITLEQVLVNVQCSLLKEKDIDLASDFLRFQPSTPWSTYIKGRLYLATGEPTEAESCFQKAAYKMAGKPSPDYHQASAGFLPPNEAAHFGQGLPFYYQHLCELFQSASCPSYAARFAQLALQFTPRSTSLDPPTSLLTSLFRSSLQTSDIQPAFTSFTRLPQHDQNNLLPILMQALMALPEGPKQLLELPWPLHVHPAIDAYLSSDTSSQIISSNKSTIPIERQRKILAAWRLKYRDFRGAATALYPQLHEVRKQKHKPGFTPKLRLGGSDRNDIDTAANREVDGAYLGIINLMACIGSEDKNNGRVDGNDDMHSEAWLLSDANGGKRRVVKISDVRQGWQKELDWRSMVESGRWGFGLVAGDEMELA